ncbi:conserved hypothetical protein [Bradyrhizobium sp. ORS 285]|uniref:DUF1045 domain-containing protein n=1 Tax=Bradyrhizobium sp. ORS 285 TaxID=115808 RepID=UPI000240728C|nr:DUF1045 domain-containing protein [Bradyrhizobium sp. ORS 285]CCD84382.1 conserved hypothetical protein [Bradyrhizobium sp. ORS 285]SMX57025.1 conserved hypothetical protein [Bradyrhizobium sp. ORS 285]
MSGFPRYAIYYAPAPDTALSAFGTDLLGYDAWTGNERDFPRDILDVLPDWAELTADARKYGFHATLKAPFPLNDSRSEAELTTTCAAFAATPRPVPIIRPVVDAISGFIAVIPGEASAELQQLAAACVETFEPFRAPMSTEDRARRKPEMLTPRQREHLDRWGYPYVMEDFRFHMTLTCRLSDERRAPVLAMLRDRFAELDLRSLSIDRIALFRQSNSTSRFRIVDSWALGGS